MQAERERKRSAGNERTRCDVVNRLAAATVVEMFSIFIARHAERYRSLGPSTQTPLYSYFARRGTNELPFQ